MHYEVLDKTSTCAACLPKRLPGFCDTSPGSSASTSQRANGVARVMSPGSAPAPRAPSAPGWLEKRPAWQLMTTCPSSLKSAKRAPVFA